LTTIEGRVTVLRNVDKIIISRTPIRLNGVDGPETSRRYGREARAFMTRLVQGETVVYSLKGVRTDDRWVGVGLVDGEDIGAIENGYALDCCRYSREAYHDLETGDAFAD